MSVARALLLVAAADGVLLAAGALGPRVGVGPALLLGCGAVLALALVARRRLPGPRLPRGGAGALALGVAAGVASLPVWLSVVAAVGLALGLGPAPPLRPGASLPVALASLGAAPVFEEILYRERLLGSLRERVGAPAALLLSAAAFALPHPGAWPRLGSFVAGLVLGAAALAGRSLPLCIGLHAGMNLGMLAAALR